MNSLFSNHESYLDENLAQFSPNFNALGDILDIHLNDEPNKKDPPVVSLASLTVIQNYTKGITRLSHGSHDLDPEPKPRPRLSTEDILRLAGEKFIQTSSRKVRISRRFSTQLSLIGLSLDEAKDVDTVKKLLSAAEKYGQKKHDVARKFLNQCDRSSSAKGNQIERIVHHFSKALREKIDRETGKVSAKDSLKDVAMRIDENIMKASPVILGFHQEIPLSQINIFAAMQVIIERIAGARKVHIIDLEIRSGLHLSILIQALADRVENPIELLKITAVTTKSKQIVEDTGGRLRSFAKSINLNFEFNIVMVKDFHELNLNLFDFEPGEKVAVSTLFGLRNMLGRQNELESLMGILKSINPSVMVVSEVEGKHNSPVFVNRFIEALFYYGAYFDCLEDCMDRDSSLRLKFESVYCGNGIRNIIVAEGDERTNRHVNLEIWRAFFSRFDMKEEEVSSSTIEQAIFVAKTYSCWNSCCIDKDGKALIIGWKGMPLQHVSAWRFEQSDPISLEGITSESDVC